MKAKVSPIIFLVTILCFALPFVTVSCNGQKLAKVSGAALAFGSGIEQPQGYNGRRGQQPDLEPLATVAYLCAFAGVLVGLLGERVPLASALVGALGVLFLLILMAKVSGDLSKQARGVVQIDYGLGFILSLLLFIGAAAWNGWLFFISRKPGMAASPPLAQSAAAAAGGPSTSSGPFCPHCGNPRSPSAKFCGGCGKGV